MKVNWNKNNGGGSGRARGKIKSTGARIAINLLVTLVFAAVYYYLALPVINLKSGSFYVFVILLCAVYSFTAMLTAGGQEEGYVRFVKKRCRIPLFISLGLVLVAIVGGIVGWQLFRAKDYRELLQVEVGDFAAEVEEISFDQIPMLDADSARKLGNRKLGELADMVSQFEVADDYTQINFRGRPVRVTPLRYGDIIKWLNNRSNGLPAYLIIDMVTQNVEVVRLNEGIRYTTAEHFSRNLNRHLRFHYPTYIFDTPAFEIDEEGNPYWVCPRIDKTIGLFGGEDIVGAVLVNAVTGECTYYDVKDVPEWVDHVYTASLILRQYDYHGKYVNGFFNSLFGQRDVTVTTDGYNYLAVGDDVYMYTGITSVVSDESNIGFILSNQRTKETRFYSCAGAEEYSSMDSAKGQVQQMKYDATFPLLLNIADQPTYFMALKDAAGLVKMYAMVNVSQYQIVATGGTVAECQNNYRKMLENNHLIDPNDPGKKPVETTEEVTGVVTEIRSAVMDGNTCYFVKLDSHDSWFSGYASDVPALVLLNVGDQVRLRFTAAAGGIAQPISSMEVAVPVPTDPTLVTG